MNKKNDNNGIITACFSGEGFFNEGKACVYIIVFTNGQNVKYYVGRTESSNHTGISSPFGRLSLHLNKRGATQSCIWEDKDIINANLDAAFLKNAQIRFYATYIDAKDVKNAEKWLIKKCPKSAECNPQYVNLNIAGNDKNVSISDIGCSESNLEQLLKAAFPEKY